MKTSSTLVTINVPPDVLFRELEGEAVILNTQSGVYFGLDEVGTRMWNLLSEHGDVEAVIPLLLEEYDVTEERLREDLERFVGELVEHGLLEVHEA